MNLKILSWNIHKGIGGVDRRYSLARVAEVIATVDPDIALLQEVADGWPGAGGDLQGELLTQMTTLKHLRFELEHRFRTGGYGNAILSRFPLEAPSRVDLKIGWRKQRSALGAHVVLPDAESEGAAGSEGAAVSAPRKVHAYSLHLGLAEKERRAQLERLLSQEHLREENEPCVIAGDFNDVFGTLGPRFMLEQGYVMAGVREPTFPASYPVFCLDGIYVRGLRIVSCSRYLGPGAKFASDHLPLVAQLETLGHPIAPLV